MAQTCSFGNNKVAGRSGLAPAVYIARATGWDGFSPSGRFRNPAWQQAGALEAAGWSRLLLPKRPQQAIKGFRGFHAQGREFAMRWLGEEAQTKGQIHLVFDLACRAVGGIQEVDRNLWTTSETMGRSGP